MNAQFIERLNDLTLLSQNHVTADHFEAEYLNTLHAISDQLRSLQALGMIQIAWLETERVKALQENGITEQ